MKSIVLVALFALALSSHIINKPFVSHLKKVAPFQVYEVEENKFKDWTDEEISKMLSFKISYTPRKEEPLKVVEEYDFRKEHPECMLGIRDQAQCGSCWSFGAITSLQERFCLQSKGEQKPILAPQDPVSCDDMCDGCNGGALMWIWTYLADYGVVEESCWPYSSGAGDVEPCRNTCKDESKPWVKYYAADWVILSGINDFRDEIVANGPINSQFMVYDDFMNYKSGIYEYTSGELRGGHSVCIVGFGSEGDKDFWIVQNSWGPDWGESGYFRIKFGECIIDVAAMTGPALLK